MNLNICKLKRLTNIRAEGKDEKTWISPPKLLTIEECLGLVGCEDLIELTPSEVRLRKKVLN